MILEYYAATKTTSKRFITEKQSKIKHCQLNNPINKDAIFIGSSRTFYHISTNEFKKNGMDIYNLGISNNSLQDYGSFVKEAIKYKPKSIIINIEVDELFQSLPISKYPTYNDLTSYSKAMNSKYISLATIQWIQNFHSLLRYSESIYLKMESFYKKYDISSGIDRSSNIKKVLDYDEIADCKIFSKKIKSDNFLTAKCENGDGILFGYASFLEKVKIDKLIKLNQETIRFINYLIHEIKKNDIVPIVVLEPVCQFAKNNDYIFDNIKKSINTPIINLTEWKTTKTMWIDSRHFNNEGRTFYSKQLENILEKMIL
jgi:hypothetical protein